MYLPPGPLNHGKYSRQCARRTLLAMDALMYEPDQPKVELPVLAKTLVQQVNGNQLELYFKILCFLNTLGLLFFQSFWVLWSKVPVEITIEIAKNIDFSGKNPIVTGLTILVHCDPYAQTFDPK